MAVPAIDNTPPLVDFLVLKHPAQSLSTNASTASGSSSVSGKCQTTRSASTKYIAILFSLGRSVSVGDAILWEACFVAYCTSERSCPKKFMRATPPRNLEASYLQRTLPSSSFPLPCTTGQLNPLESSFKPKSLKSFNREFRLASSSKPLFALLNLRPQYLDLLRVISATAHDAPKLDVTPRLHPISECH